MAFLIDNIMLIKIMIIQELISLKTIKILKMFITLNIFDIISTSYSMKNFIVYILLNERNDTKNEKKNNN